MVTWYACNNHLNLGILVDIIQSKTRPYDPVEILLDYILAVGRHEVVMLRAVTDGTRYVQHSEADLAIASDMDIAEHFAVRVYIPRTSRPC